MSRPRKSYAPSAPVTPEAQEAPKTPRWLVVYNMQPNYLAAEGEGWALSLAPAGYPGSYAVFSGAQIDVLLDDTAINRLSEQGVIVLGKVDRLPHDIAWPADLPEDRWLRQAIVDVVLGDEDRADNIVNMQIESEMGVSDSAARSWLLGDFRTILVAAERWLMTLPDDDRTQQRLALVQQRLEQIRSM